MNTPIIKPSMKTLQLFVLLVVVCATPLAEAQTTYLWNVATPAVNYWDVNGNWNVANYPGFSSTADTAIFGSTGTSSASTTVNNQVRVNTTIIHPRLNKGT